MAAGNRGGFNPYRDSHGRYSAPSGGGAQINAAIRQAAGRSAQTSIPRGTTAWAGGAAKGDVPASAPTLGKTTLGRGNVGSGKASMMQNVGTDSEHFAAIGRAPAKGTSLEKPFTTPALSKATRALLEEDGDSVDPEMAHILKGGPVDLLDSMAYIARDVRGGTNIGHAILKDNGFIPRSATIQHVDDLLATRYEHESAPQYAMRMLRAMGTAIAAGHDPETVMTQLGDTTSPSQDEYANDVAREAGQSPDAPNG